MKVEAIPLGMDHLHACMTLSVQAGWNQTERDWRMIFDIGMGQGLFEGRRLVACAAIMPYGGVVGWVCMVLVAADRRRRGLATILMEWALDTTKAMGLVAGLDATPDGRKVYEKLGFVDIFALSRLQAPNVTVADTYDATSLRPMADTDIDAVAAIDMTAFGANRTRLVSALRERRPDCAFVAVRDGHIDGFVLGRDGRSATQIGPVVASSETTARALLSAALRNVDGAVFIDLADRHQAVRAWLEDCGFSLQRPFMRMLAQRSKPFGEPERIIAVAGPELA